MPKGTAISRPSGMGDEDASKIEFEVGSADWNFIALEKENMNLLRELERCVGGPLAHLQIRFGFLTPNGL